MTDLEALKKLVQDVGGPSDYPQFYAGHLGDSSVNCECPYIFDGGHAGGVGQVFIDNGLPISEGGNDAPPRELAAAYMRLIVGAVNALPTLIELLETQSGD